MSPLAVGLLRSGDGARAVVEASRWLQVAGGFDLAFAYAGYALEAPLVLRIRGGVARCEMPPLGTLTCAQAMGAMAEAVDVLRSAEVGIDADVHLVDAGTARSLPRLSHRLGAEFTVATPDDLPPPRRGRDGFSTLYVQPALELDTGGPIVCGLTGDDARPIEVATRISRALGRPLIVHAAPGRVLQAPRDAPPVLAGLGDGVGTPVDHRTVPLDGDPLSELARLARRTAAELVVVGARHRHKRALMTQRMRLARLMSQSSRPLLVV